MITLVLAMIRARSAQAVTAFLLGMFAVAAAVSAPAYVSVADSAVVSGEVNAAPLRERSLTAGATADHDSRDFEVAAQTAFAIPGFRTIFAAETDVIMDAERGRDVIVPRYVYRDDLCAHITLLSGRCFAAITEVVLPKDGADRLGVGVGDALRTWFATYDSTNETWVKTGDPTTYTVVGVYRPTDAGDHYWGSNNYFRASDTRYVAAPVFADRRSVGLSTADRSNQTVDVVAGDGAITADSLDDVRAGIDRGVAQLRTVGVKPRTDLPVLLARIDRNRSLVAELVPLAAAPLVLLCWFVIFVTVAASTQERRNELGLLALRGVRRPFRWWLAAGETVLPILLGSVAGFFAGQLLIRAIVTVTLGTHDGPLLPAGVSRWVLLTAAGAVLAGVLAQRRELAQPTADLLRRVPDRLRRWRAAILESVVVIVAIAAIAQRYTGGGDLTGISLLIPALIVLAIGLVVARAVVPIADRVGARALRRGRLRTMLAAYGMARRPGSQRILALLVVAVGLLCFSATAVDVSGEARADRASVQLGAPRVLSLDEISRTALLAKVRAADPEGRFAMAVAQMPDTVAGEPTKLAVDSSRLAAVANWHAGDGPNAVTAAARLHPVPSGQPIVLKGTDIQIDATVDSLPSSGRPRLIVSLTTLDGLVAMRVNLGFLKTGRHTYTGPAMSCGGGCRVGSIEAAEQPDGPFVVDMVLHEMRSGGQVVVDRGALARPDAWRGSVTPGERLAVARLQPEADGLRVRQDRDGASQVSVVVLPTDTPASLPVIAGEAAHLPATVTGFDLASLSAQQVGRVTAVPKLGRTGVLVDFEYAERMSTTESTAARPEVWLSADAPPDAVTRLRAQGLEILDDSRLSTVQQSFNRQGPSVALRFSQIAGAFAVLLAMGALWLVASVDRRQRAKELQALRAQGLPRRAAGAAAYLPIVLTAAVVGPFAGLLSWFVAGEAMPIFADDVHLITPPRWPGVPAVGLPWLIAVVVLAAIALLAARRLAAVADGRGSR